MGRKFKKAMTPKAQAANEANAQKSTGPKTGEGKEASKYNATWHGFRGTRILLPGESMDEFLALLDVLRVGFQPIGEYECTLVKRMAEKIWELERAGGLKKELLQHNEFRDKMTQEVMRLSWYEECMDRSLIRLRKELTAVQKLRGKDFTKMFGENPDPENPPKGTLRLTQPGEYIGPASLWRESQGEAAAEQFMESCAKKALFNKQDGLTGWKAARQVLEEKVDQRLSVGHYDYLTEPQPPIRLNNNPPDTDQPNANGASP